MTKIKKSILPLVLLVIMLPIVETNSQTTSITEAPLFNSIDENFNPVSMADMIDGKPLVIAVSSCS
jgi:hypothetical protein